MRVRNMRERASLATPLLACRRARLTTSACQHCPKTRWRCDRERRRPFSGGGARALRSRARGKYRASRADLSFARGAPTLTVPPRQITPTAPHTDCAWRPLAPLPRAPPSPPQGLGHAHHNQSCRYKLRTCLAYPSARPRRSS